MIVRHNVFYNIRQRKTKLKYTGTKHRNNLVKNLLSRYMQTNPTVAGIINFIEPVISHLIDSIRDIKKYRNPMIHKNFYDFN